MTRGFLLCLVVLLCGCSSSPPSQLTGTLSAKGTVDAETGLIVASDALEEPAWVVAGFMSDDEHGYNCQRFYTGDRISFSDAKSNAKDMARIELFKKRNGSQRVSATEILNAKNGEVDITMNVKAQLGGYMPPTSVLKEEVISGDGYSLYCVKTGTTF